MANFAVLDSGNYVINCIVADSKAIAEEITGKLCVQFTEENPADIGGLWNGTKFIPKQQYASWILNISTNTWEPPTPMPTEGFGWTWDEQSVSWKQTILDHPGLLEQ